MINRLTEPMEVIYHRANFRSSDRAIMAHEIAKLLLEHADTFLERQEAVKTALQLGMPLHEIEEYLDWLDTMRSSSDDNAP